MMKNFFIIKWLNSITIAKRLYFTVSIMAILILVELFSLWFAINTLSSVRAYVQGEGLWSKAQKDALYQLQEYSRIQNDRDYYDFLDFMKVPLGDRKARLELNKKNPDLAVVRQGFL